MAVMIGAVATLPRYAFAVDGTRLRTPVLLSKNTIRSIYPTVTPETATAFNNMGAGQAISFSCAINAPDRREWYRAAGAGHNNGLNHVIAYNETTGLYRLVAPPAPLCTSPNDDIIIGKNPDGTAMTIKAAALAPDPVNGWPIYPSGYTWKYPKWGPVSCHTYGGGTVYSTKTRKLYHFQMPEGFPINVSYGPKFYSFDPDDCQGVNHGWTRCADFPVALNAGLGTLVSWETADGRLAFLSSTYSPSNGCFLGYYDPATDIWSSVVAVSGTKISYGTGRFVREENAVYLHNFDAFYRIGLPPNASFKQLNLRAMSAYQSDAFIVIGNWIYSWNAATHMLRINKGTGQWQALFGLNLPVWSFVYNGIRVADDGKSFLVDAGETGFWSVPIPGEDAGWGDVDPLHAELAQSYVDAAAAGSSVTIPAGSYRDSLNINKALDIHMKGVVLLGQYQEKGPVVVTTPDKVRIYDYECLGTTGDNATAALRNVGKLDLELYNFHAANCPNGIVIDNAGGSLLIDGFLVEKMTGDGAPYTHGFYVGRIDSVTFKNGSVLGQGIKTDFGHLYKSRARVTTMIACKGLGGDGTYSREVDLPCGGKFSADASCVFEKGPNAQNLDHVSYAVEGAANCTFMDGVNLCTVPGSFDYSAILTSKKAGAYFGTYKGAQGTTGHIDKAKLPASLPAGSFPSNWFA